MDRGQCPPQARALGKVHLRRSRALGFASPAGYGARGPVGTRVDRAHVSSRDIQEYRRPAGSGDRLDGPPLRIDRRDQGVRPSLDLRGPLDRTAVRRLVHRQSRQLLAAARRSHRPAHARVRAGDLEHPALSAARLRPGRRSRRPAVSDRQRLRPDLGVAPVGGRRCRMGELLSPAPGAHLSGILDSPPHGAGRRVGDLDARCNPTPASSSACSASVSRPTCSTASRHRGGTLV
jgi:hypothetical protein